MFNILEKFKRYSYFLNVYTIFELGIFIFYMFSTWFQSFFQFVFIKIIRITKEIFVSILFSPGRELWLTPRMGMGGQQIIQKTLKIKIKHLVRKLFTLLDTFLKKNIKNIFKIYSYIQKTTPNPINTLKMTIYNTKHTKHTKQRNTKSKVFEIFQNKK